MKTITLIALAGLTAIAPAQISKSGAGYLFRMKHTPGSVLKFNVLSTIGGAAQNGKPMQFTLPMVWKIASVKNGVATIDTSVGPISMGKEPMMEASKNRIQIDSRGRLVGQAGSGQQVTPSYPEQIVKVGQSWTASAPISLPTQGESKIIATYTFKGMKAVGGRQMAELSVKTSGQAIGTGTMLLLAKDGSLFRSQLNMKLSMTSPNGTPSAYNVTAQITRS